MRDDIEDRGKEWYNYHGWAVANNILSDEELAVYQKQVGDIKRGEYYHETQDGLYMIPTGENGIFNVLVYTDAKCEAPSIKKY